LAALGMEKIIKAPTVANVGRVICFMRGL